MKKKTHKIKIGHLLQISLFALVLTATSVISTFAIDGWNTGNGNVNVDIAEVEGGDTTFEARGHSDTGKLSSNDTLKIINADGTGYVDVTWENYIKNPALLNAADKYDEIMSSPYRIFKTHRDMSINAGEPVTYANDGFAKNSADFYPPGASAAEKKWIDFVYSTADKRYNGGISKGTVPTNFIYVTAEEVRACMEKGTCTPPPDVCKNGSCGAGPIKKEEDDPKKSITSCNVGGGPKFQFARTVGAGGDTISGPYAVMVNVIPVKPRNFNSLTMAQQSEWMRTHKAQTIGPVKTPFGEFLEANKGVLSQLQGFGKSGGIAEASSYRRTWERFAAGARSAIAKGVPLLTVQLDELNALGNNRGGVYTFTELIKTASVSASHSQDKYDQYDCVTKSRLEYYTVKVLNEDNEWVSEDRTRTVYYTQYEKTKSNVDIDGNFTNGAISAVVGGDFSPSKSYQTISVKCNYDEFNALVSSTGSSVLTNTKSSQSAKSPIVSGGVASFFNHLDVDFFYNGKSCNTIYGCSAEPVNTNDDRDRNLGNGGNIVDSNKFGAQSDGKNASEFAFFRDNLSKLVRLDIWFPQKREEGGIAYNNEPAVKTYIILDKNGTPQEDFFKMTTKDGREVMTGRNLKSRWYTQLPGMINEYKFSGSWASDTGKPHRIMSIHAFKPTTSASIPTSYNRDGGNTKEMEDVIDMLCVTRFNSTDVTDPIIIHKTKELTDETFSEFDEEDDNNHFKVNFVKSSAE